MCTNKLKNKLYNQYITNNIIYKMNKQRVNYYLSISPNTISMVPITEAKSPK